jgi:hypothetical protein
MIHTAFLARRVHGFLTAHRNFCLAGPPTPLQLLLLRAAALGASAAGDCNSLGDPAGLRAVGGLNSGIQQGATSGHSSERTRELAGRCRCSRPGGPLPANAPPTSACCLSLAETIRDQRRSGGADRESRSSSPGGHHAGDLPCQMHHNYGSCNGFKPAARLNQRSVASGACTRLDAESAP